MFILISLERLQLTVNPMQVYRCAFSSRRFTWK